MNSTKTHPCLDSMSQKKKTKTAEEIIASWPKWKRDIHICGSQMMVGTRMICACTHPKEVAAIREQERADARQYSYWPEG